MTIPNLFKAIYGNRVPGTPSNVSHDEVIKIFTDTLNSLGPEVNTYPPLLAGSPSHARKHALGIHDNNLGKWGQKRRKTSSIETEVASSVSGNHIWIAVSGEEILARSASRGRRSCHASTSRSGASGKIVMTILHYNVLHSRNCWVDMYPLASLYSDQQ